MPKQRTKWFHHNIRQEAKVEAKVKFDSARKRVIVSAQISNCQKLFFVSKSIWVPQEDGENREAGEKPARSRHCDETSSLLLLRGVMD